MTMVGQRCEVRLTTRCNSGCAHCAVAGLRGGPEPTVASVWEEIQQGRSRGADQLVFLPGEPTLVRELLKLVRRARGLGYGEVRVDTNARMLGYATYAEKLVAAGVTEFLVSWFGPSAALHDAVDGTDGAFDQAQAGVLNLLAAGAVVRADIPVVRQTWLSLSQTVETLHRLGVRRLRFTWGRPVKVGPGWVTDHVMRLSEAAPSVREALSAAASLGIEATTRAIPLCHLTDDGRGGWSDDIAPHLAGPRAPSCRACPLVSGCPRTWAEYQALMGTWELEPPSTTADPS